MATARLSGVNLHYEVSGNGPAVTLAHGFADSMAFWDGQVDVLSEQFTVVRYDQRGHGDSDDRTEGMSIGALASDLVKLLDCLQIEKTAIIGHSMGGRVAFQFSLAFPERTWALVPVDAECSPPEREYAKLVHDLGIVLKTVGLEGLLRTFEAAGEVPVRAMVDPVWGNAYRRRFLSNRPGALLDALRAIVQMPHLCEDLSTLTTPTLVVVGEHDGPVRQSVVRYAPLIRNCAVVVVPNVQHCPNVDAPEFFNQILVEFLLQVSMKA